MSNYYVGQLLKLIDGTIESVATDESDEGDFFALVIKLSSGEKRAVWFYRDDEGNGPGSFLIQEIP